MSLRMRVVLDLTWADRSWPWSAERSFRETLCTGDAPAPHKWAAVTMIQCSTLCTQRKGTKFPCFWGLVFGAQFQHFLEFFLPIFCSAVSSCVYDHSHPYLVSECLFLAENKAFPYPRRLRAHPRRLRAILWEAAATCPVVIFVVVAEKKRSPNLSGPWLTFYGLDDRLPSPLVTLDGHSSVIF